MAENTSEEVCYKRCSDFLKIANEFQLGDLSTEKSNPLTHNLSYLSQTDLHKAITILRNVDIHALEILATCADKLFELRDEIGDTIENGNKVFLCGCGATGRLSLSLEFIWRNNCINEELFESVVGFMAGGDVAIINSIEKFEDFPAYGARHLKELGFGNNDLLIAITEGGETPFVIGAAEESINISGRKPYFLYCNPDDVLLKSATRSRNIINNPLIRKINLDVGPMAITGSTRMQASTILMYAIGLCLMNYKIEIDFEKSIREFISKYKSTPITKLSSLITREDEIYNKGEYIYYETDENYGLAVLTDTTERSPTFSLIPFENQNSEIIEPSLSYLLFPNCKNSYLAWEKLLLRKPRAVNWKDVSILTCDKWLYGFDFSNNLIKSRQMYLPARSRILSVKEDNNNLILNLEGINFSINTEELSLLEKHLVLKMILNIHSTLIMGRQERYDGNLMTWVRPSNNKLIDRTIRYISILLTKEGKYYSYNEISRICFLLMPKISRNESIVMAVKDHLMKE